MRSIDREQSAMRSSRPASGSAAPAKAILMARRLAG